MPDSTPAPGPKAVRIPCSECGGGYRQHDVLYEHQEDLGDEHYRAWGTYQICKCRGCEKVRFREATSSEDDRDYDTGELNESVRVFPLEHGPRRNAIDAMAFPAAVERMYEETVRALNAGAPVLAAG